MILHAHHLRVELPRGWSGRLFARNGELATLHVANFTLPLNDGEFGDRSTGLMPRGGAFAALTEYGPGRNLTAGRGLFARSRMPLPLDPTDLARERLQHGRHGQVGAQHFFTAAERPFCLYVVLSGDRSGRRRQLTALNHVLGTVRIGRRDAQPQNN